MYKNASNKYKIVNWVCSHQLVSTVATIHIAFPKQDILLLNMSGGQESQKLQIFQQNIFLR